MNDVAKELLRTLKHNGPVLRVNGEKTDSGKVIKVDYRAASGSGEPSVEILLKGPWGMKVRIEYAETAESKANNWNKDRMNKRVIRKGTDNAILAREEISELVQGDPFYRYNGCVELTLSEVKGAKVEFRTRGLSAKYAFKVVAGDRPPISFNLEIVFTAHRFMQIPYNGSSYTGYGSREASWGLPELKTFIDKFAAKHLQETKKKPYIGNKAVRDGVKYRPHDGVSHARGYAVDIDFGVDTGNAKVGEKGYDEKAHRAQIKRYLACGANLVFIGNKKLAKGFGSEIRYDKYHDDHDHVNAI